MRKLDPFRKFLPIVAQMNGKVLNYSKIACDIGVDANTVQSYYQILEETLIGFYLPSYHVSLRKQQRIAPKFYFFDLGIKKALERKLNIEIVPETTEYGFAFEHLIISKCVALNEYFNKDYDLSYLLTKDGLEIDLIIDRPGMPPIFIEIKSRSKIVDEDFRHLFKISKDSMEAEYLLLSQDPISRKKDKILALPWQKGLEKIFNI